jgi:hypothetical protein
MIATTKVLMRGMSIEALVYSAHDTRGATRRTRDTGHGGHGTRDTGRERPDGSRADGLNRATRSREALARGTSIDAPALGARTAQTERSPRKKYIPERAGRRGSRPQRATSARGMTRAAPTFAIDDAPTPRRRPDPAQTLTRAAGRGAIASARSSHADPHAEVGGGVRSSLQCTSAPTWHQRAYRGGEVDPADRRLRRSAPGRADLLANSAPAGRPSRPQPRARGRARSA